MTDKKTEIPAKYDPSQAEDRWYADWLAKGYFHSEPDTRKPFTVVIPPPNVTGVLHMGHMLNNTIQDVLVRRARLRGFNACWVPGTDHASIATEAKVVQLLASQGIKKQDLTREEFLAHAWKWKEKHGGIILQQLRKLGASCDWDRTKFTMDEPLSRSVIKVFVQLYNEGKIYRGIRMVNWDPKALTALSDEEVIYKEHEGKLYYLRYRIEGDEKHYAVVATTRPETIFGDTAMCINPKDPKNKHLRGKRVIVPICGRSIPVIEDEYVDIEFGTGCLKVTPAHDINDYMLGEKYNLPSIDIFNDNGTLNEHGLAYAGMDRFDVREKIEIDLKEAGLLEKVETYTNQVGTSERTGVPIEPKLSMQWFLKMEELAQPALKAVMEDIIKLYPAKFKNTYRHWMENVRDWCVSRQLWWGQRIPAYYLPEGGFVVAETPEEALELAKKKNPSIKAEDLKQDPDVLDTWFSSWLWPISVFDGINNPGNRDIEYYYPTDDLVTAPEILFFWVARMIIAGYKFKGDRPFSNVYLTGIVRDKLRRKMSKSLGNSPDPLELISKYGADSVRVAMMLCTTAGNDIIWDDSLIEQGRNFGNKIWNTFRLLKMWNVEEKQQPCCSAVAVEWFESLLNKTVKEIDRCFDEYRISDAMMTLYKLFWDDFSASYLEIIKPPYGESIDSKTFNKTIEFYETLLKHLHPYMPFITEEIWHYIRERGEKESIMVSRYNEPGAIDEKRLEHMGYVLDIVSAIRNIRVSKNISPKESLNLMAIVDENYPVECKEVIRKLANVEIEETDKKPAMAESFIVKTTEYFIVLEGKIDLAAQKDKLQKDLDYAEKFLQGVMKKLSNERFVNSAPKEVVDKERMKQSDAEKKIKALKTQIEQLNS